MINSLFCLRNKRKLSIKFKAQRLVLISLMTAVSAFADTYQGKDLFDLDLEELSNIPISAVSKSGLTKAESPASVQVITREEIERFGYRTIGEALGHIAGFYQSTDRNYDYLGVRGFSRPGDYNSRVLILLDGHRLNDSQYDYVGIGQDSTIDLLQVERIEVVKGPSSAVWGTNALLAVINIITKSASPTSKNSITIAGGSQQTSKVVTEFSHYEPDGLSIAGSIAGTNTNGEDQLFFSELEDPINNYGISSDRDSENAIDTYLKVNYGDLQFLFNYGRRKKEIPTGSFGSVLGLPGQATTDDGYHTDLSYTHELNSSTKFLLRTYYDRVSFAGDQKYPDPDLGVYNYHDDSSAQVIGTEARIFGDWAEKLTYVSGVEYQKANPIQYHSFINDPYFDSAADIDASFGLTSFFLDGQWAFAPKWSLSLGGRLDKYTYLNQQLNPRAGLIYKIAEQSRLKLLAGTAFRAPNSYERLYQSQGFIPGGNLGPEKLKSYELVFEQELDMTNLSISFYNYELNNLVSQESVDDGFLQYFNSGGIESRGVEFQASRRTSEGYIFDLSGTAARAADQEHDNRLSNSPLYSGAFRASLPVIKDLTYLNAQIQMLGTRPDIYGNHISSECFTNLFITSKLKQNWDLRFGLYNIFDQVRYSPGANEHAQRVIPWLGRNLLLSMRYSF